MQCKTLNIEQQEIQTLKKKNRKKKENYQKSNQEKFPKLRTSIFKCKSLTKCIE